MAHTEQEFAQALEDVELLAQRVQELGGELESRFEGVRRDFDEALLTQMAKVSRRFERLEALLAEKVTGQMAEELLAELSGL